MPRPPMDQRVQTAAAEILGGQQRGLRAVWPFLGPALIASVAYIDPGNFATNIQAGSQYRYQLLWVVLFANIVAMLFQGLSARVGIVTGQNLAQLCQARFSPTTVFVLWAISEIGAMATDLAEMLGAAIGLSLLFHWSLLVGMVLAGVISFAILVLEEGGFRKLEWVIGGFVGIIGLCYGGELVLMPPDLHAVMRGLAMPTLPDNAALLLAIGIFGATVMPHAIFLHSGLTQGRIHARNEGEKRRLIGFSNLEVVLALSVAGFINLAMVMMAAVALKGQAAAGIETAYRTLVPAFGGAAAAIFLLSLLASGISASVVGTMAGQMIMQGFLRVSGPVWLRRLITMLPGIGVVALGLNVTKCLILSQVVLSFVLPVPMIALVIFCRDRKIMGDFVVTGWVLHSAILATAVTLLLNIALVWQTLAGS